MFRRLEIELFITTCRYWLGEGSFKFWFRFHSVLLLIDSVFSMLLWIYRETVGLCEPLKLIITCLTWRLGLSHCVICVCMIERIIVLIDLGSKRAVRIIIYFKWFSHGSILKCIIVWKPVLTLWSLSVINTKNNY